jgi:hypothetical protein
MINPVWKRAAIPAVVVLALLIAGCGKQPEPDSRPSPSDSSGIPGTGEQEPSGTERPTIADHHVERASGAAKADGPVRGIG